MSHQVGIRSFYSPPNRVMMSLPLRLFISFLYFLFPSSAHIYIFKYPFFHTALFMPLFSFRFFNIFGTCTCAAFQDDSYEALVLYHSSFLSFFLSLTPSITLYYPLVLISHHIPHYISQSLVHTTFSSTFFDA